VAVTAGVRNSEYHQSVQIHVPEGYLSPVAATVKEHPYLTAEEMEQQYRSVINKAMRTKQQDDTGRHFVTVRHTFARAPGACDVATAACRANSMSIVAGLQR
jgi:hypothetical protein